MGRRVQEFEAEAGPWPALEQILDLLRLDASYAVRAGGSLPLGSRGGVPPRAGAVDLAGVLDKRFPELAAQVREPRLLLLRARERPKKLRRPFVRLDSTYKELVQRNVSSGLQRLVPEEAVWKHAGRTLKGAGFAVAKDAVEDRAISDLPINELLDPKRLPRPVFAYTPRLRALRTRKGATIKVRKRDARHYFHQLRIGRRWHKYLAHPSIQVDGKVRYPLHQVAPMGFAPSAGWAQGVTDTVTADADLPACASHCVLDDPVSTGVGVPLDLVRLGDGGHSPLDRRHGQTQVGQVGNEQRDRLWRGGHVDHACGLRKRAPSSPVGFVRPARGGREGLLHELDDPLRKAAKLGRSKWDDLVCHLGPPIGLAGTPA